MAPNGSIPAVPAAAHAGDQIVLLKELLPLIAGELGTLVRCPAAVCLQTARGGMHVDLGLWFAPPDSHEQGLQRQIGVGAALH
jgi:glutamine synthetase